MLLKFPLERMQYRHQVAALTVNRIMTFAAVDYSSHCAALGINATSGAATEQPASDLQESEPTKLHSLPFKPAQTTSVDSDAEAVERLLQCPLTKVSAVFEPPRTASIAGSQHNGGHEGLVHSAAGHVASSTSYAASGRSHLVADAVSSQAYVHHLQGVGVLLQASPGLTQ